MFSAQAKIWDANKLLNYLNSFYVFLWIGFAKVHSLQKSITVATRLFVSAPVCVSICLK